MTLIEQINADFMTSYKNKEMEKKDFIGVLKTEVTKESKNPDDAYIVNKIKNMIKNANATNSLSDFELEILNRYLPKQLTEGEVNKIVSEYLESVENANIGQVMTFLKSNYGGQYDGRLASEIVKKLI